MADYLILRFEGPLQAWGGVAVDTVRPTREYPSLSGITGLLASALGWEYRDAAKTSELQASLSYAVREDRPPQLLRDFQTADLGRIGTRGWTRRGIEERGGGFAKGTQVLEKYYLADASFTVAIGLSPDAPVSLNDLAEAIQRPGRPLYLGRKSCPPAGPVFIGRRSAKGPFEALQAVDFPADQDRLRCWYAEGDGPPTGLSTQVWDRRDFVADWFAGSRRVVEGFIEPLEGSE